MPITLRPIRVEGKDAFVTLFNGREVVFDADKVHLVEGFNWSAAGIGYACRMVTVNGKRRPVYLHRLLADAPDGVYVDHIDGDICNVRSINLRQCTNSQNLANRGAQKNNTSGFKGVTARGHKWQAAIKVNGQYIHLGTRDTPEEAYALYVDAAHKHFGEFARTS
jgi:hypothetical protein